MRNNLVRLLFLLLCIDSQAQSAPNCSQLTVESIQLDNDTGNLMKVTISNSCSNCASGFGGCLYYDLKVIRTVAPFDTIAVSSYLNTPLSSCYCLQSPDNNAQKTYAIITNVSTLPPLSDIRVSFICGVDGCDTIPYAAALGIENSAMMNYISIFPNPANDFIMIDCGAINGLKFKLTDTQGKIVRLEELNLAIQRIDLSALPNGLYFIEIMDNNAKIIQTKKLMLE